MGTMGYGLCAGMVASLVRGDTGRSIVVAGDGGIQMTINELGTVKQLFAQSSTKHKLLVIVFDNERLSRVFFGFEGALGCELGPSPDFVGLAKAYGGDGATLSSPHELKRTMELAFSSEGLFLLHVLVDPKVKADMAVFKDKSTKMANSG
jgi:thiamine pyrophosphate-dependent acetolactate synthase large subunit-like protein